MILLKNALAGIEGRHGYNIGNGLCERTLRPEMAGPFVLSWLEQPGELTCISKDRAYIPSLVTVAENAGICQVALMSRTTMFQADDMINLATEEGVIFMD